MKKWNIFLSVFIVTALCFWALIGISAENQYTSVRKYTKPKQNTATSTKETIIPVSEKETVAPSSGEAIPPVTSGTASSVTVDAVPPVIEFLNHKDGETVTSSLVNILVKVTDDQSSPDKITIEWAGRQRLVNGFNPIVVTATDEAGNVGSAYIVIEKK